MSGVQISALMFLCAACAASAQEVGNDVCRGCHAEIYRKYSLTAMFRRRVLCDVDMQNLPASVLDNEEAIQ